MLQNIRQHSQGTAAKVIIGLIVVSFAGFGIQSLLLDGGTNEVAVVNGENISSLDLQLAIQNQKRRLFAMYGDSIDPAMLDDERMAPQSLEALVNQTLLLQSAEEMGVAVSEREIGSIISSMEQFQVGGVFSADAYKAMLSQAGYTPGSYKDSLRKDLVLNQVSAGLAASEFATPAELELNARIMSEQRDFRYFTIPQENFAEVPDATELEIENYYNERLEEYRTPEVVEIEYLELTREDFNEPVAESVLLEAYELAVQDQQYQTQHRVSHILFESGGESSVQERLAEAREKLAAGEAFTDVARDLSDDIGSRDRGGDLGYTSGEAFPVEMEEAIADLEPGTVSDAVETDAGTHLLLVTERKPGEPPAFEDMRAELEQGIQTEEARVELVRTVEALRDVTFNADDLAGPADEFGLTVQTQESVSRNHTEGLFANSNLLEAAFSEDVFEAGHNSEVIEIPGERFVVLRVSARTPSEIAPLADVRESIVEAIRSAVVTAAVTAEANDVLKALQGGEEIESLAQARGYELMTELGAERRNNVIPPDILDLVFGLTAPVDGAASSNDYIVTPGGDAVVVSLGQVTPGEYDSLAELEQQQLRQGLAGELGGLIIQEYQRGLRERADISVL